MTKFKQRILSVFLSFCMIFMCMAGMTVTASAANTSHAILIFNDGNEVYGYNTWTEQGELLPTSAYTLTYKDSNEQTVESSANWTTVTATVTSGTYAGEKGTEKHSYVLADNESWDSLGSGAFFNDIKVFPSIKKLVAYKVGKPIPASWLEIGFLDCSMTGGISEDMLSSVFPTAPGEYRAYITKITNNHGQTIRLGMTEYAAFTVAEPSDVDLATCSISVDTANKTVSVLTASNQTVPTNAYTLEFFKIYTDASSAPLDTALPSDSFVTASNSVDLGTSVGSSFPTDEGTYFVVATAVSGSGFTGYVTSSDFTVTGSSDISLMGGTLSVNTETFETTLSVNGKTVPTDAYRVDFEQVVEGGDPITLVGYPTNSGTYFAVATAISGKGYTGYVMSMKFVYKKLKLSVTATSVKKGFTIPLKARYNGYDATDSVTWKTSDPTVATVSDKGLVTGVGVGTAIITAIADEEATCKVTVTDDSSSGGGNTPEGPSTPTEPTTPARQATTDTPSTPTTPTTPTTPAAGSNADDDDKTPDTPKAETKEEVVSGKDDTGNNVTKTTKTSDDGSVTTEIVKTDSEGNILSETKKNEITVVEDDGTKKTTTKTTVTDSETGEKKETEKVTEIAEDGTKIVTSKKTVTNSEGEETVTESKTVTNEKGTETKDTTVTYEDGSQILQLSVTKKSGASRTTNVKKDENGEVERIVTEQKSAQGETVTQRFVPTDDGEIALTKVESDGGKDNITVPSTVTSPEGDKLTVTAIAPNAFTGIDATSITIPKSVVEFKKGAFDGSNANKVKIKLKSAKNLKIEEGAFDGLDENSEIKIVTDKKLSGYNKLVIRAKFEAAGVDPSRIKFAHKK